MTTIGLYAIDTSTTLESNKSLFRLSLWRVKPPRIPGGPSAIGRRVRSPRKSANAGLWRPSAPAVSGGVYNQAGLQPQRVEYWLNAKPDDPVAFTTQVAAG